MAAPDLALPDQSGATWRLADHRGAAALLIFYRGDW
jgi:peroxiredoxin